jgi:pyrroloquinoline quinone (PQQ) biosynthesis protein C
VISSIVEQTNTAAGGCLLASDLVSIARAHPCASHPLFNLLRQKKLSLQQAGALLSNYAAHANFLRRFLLRAATIMPEGAVGFVLENVRTEYGSGKHDNRHQLQLLHLAQCLGLSRAEFDRYPIRAGVKRFIRDTAALYYPLREKRFVRSSKSAIAAGAITATEILALEEFKAMQVAFAQFGLENHIWFDHVSIEVDHTSESLALAQYFMSEPKKSDAVLIGFNGVLDANVSLYDGLLSCLA